MKKSKILICIYSDVLKHSRVTMEIEALRNNYHVVCAGLGDSKIEGIEYINIQNLYEPNYKRVRFKVKDHLVKYVYRIYRILFSNTYKEIERFENTVDYFSPRLLKKFKEIQPNVLIIHDFNLLPLAKELKGDNCAIIFNAHEYYPEVMASDKDWEHKYQQKVILKLKKYLPIVNVLFAVSEGIKEKYLKEFGKDSVVIKNSKPFYNIFPKLVDKLQIKLVHHGSSVPIRKLEETIEVMNLLPNIYTLDLFLNPAYEDYHDNLVNRYASHPRIKFNRIVPTAELPNILNQYDIGICMFPPVNFNLEMMLPNKFFEFVQARNAIVAGPTTELKKYIQQYDLGIVTKGYTTKDLAEAILSLSVEKVNYFKQQCHKHAKTLSYENELQLISNTVDSMIKKRETIYA